MEPRNCTVLGAAQCEYPNTLPVRAQTACTSNYHTTAEPYATRVNGQPAVLCSQKRRALVLGLASFPGIDTTLDHLQVGARWTVEAATGATTDAVMTASGTMAIANFLPRTANIRSPRV
jgi:hypothetical protein